MGWLDWAALAGYSLVMVLIGLWSKRQVRDAADFFVAGGRMPWWLAGVSHHMSGYSSAVFVGYAAIAYTEGFVLYVWWALGISLAMLIGSVLFAHRWARLRHRFGVVSPTEYLAIRYNVPTQQLLAWSGAALKIFDVGAKWTATAVLLEVFAGVPLAWGVLLTGGVTMVYCTIGGLWADVLTDAGQFVIQAVAGVVMLVAVLGQLGGLPALWEMWGELPASHSRPFTGEYTPTFVLVFLLIFTLSYNGGTWNLAQRFLALPDDRSARRTAWLSAALYLVWPLVLFFPMWAAPLLLPGLDAPEQSYARLTQELLPSGLLGLVVAGLFAHTMSMSGGDANAIASVVVRDIVPTVWKRARRMSPHGELVLARLSVFSFIALSMGLALTADTFGGVLGLLILWFGALVGPIAIPMLLGLLPWFKGSGPGAAIGAWATGLGVFLLTRYVLAGPIRTLAPDLVTTITVAGPVLCALAVFVGVGWLAPRRNEAAEALVDTLSRPVEPARVTV